ncbi:MAG: ATP-binding protein [Anaerovoracaceae bacterium]
MKRKAENSLIIWKDSKDRKPLLLNGIRQVGKTWLLKEFGRTQYTNTVYLNFDKKPEFIELFARTKDPARLIPSIALATDEKILPQKTLIIFDEIQECPNALNSLKYFCEEAAEYHIVAAGSLLGVALSKSTFPVGKIDFIDINPLTFTEFLDGTGNKNFVEYMSQIDKIEPIPEIFFNPLLEKLKEYFITGGLPEPINKWNEELDVPAVQSVLLNILRAYERDFGKHSDDIDVRKISIIWKSLSSQLSKENKKFLYSAAKGGARAREYEDALNWLVDAGLAIKVHRVKKIGLPMAAYEDLSAFKIFLPDVGLLRRTSQLAPSAVVEGDRLFTEFKGALSENYILQSLKNQFEVLPHYLSSNKPKYEIDFLIQIENDIYPIEVKSGRSVKSNSLKKIESEASSSSSLKIRYSLNNLTLDDDILNIPTFMADYTEKLIEIALASKGI